MLFVKECTNARASSAVAPTIAFVTRVSSIGDHAGQVYVQRWWNRHRNLRHSMLRLRHFLSRQQMHRPGCKSRWHLKQASLQHLWNRHRDIWHPMLRLRHLSKSVHLSLACFRGRRAIGISDWSRLIPFLLLSLPCRSYFYELVHCFSLGQLCGKAFVWNTCRTAFFHRKAYIFMTMQGSHINYSTRQSTWKLGQRRQSETTTVDSTSTLNFSLVLAWASSDMFLTVLDSFRNFTLVSFLGRQLKDLTAVSWFAFSIS